MCNLEACERNSKNKYGGYCYKHRQRYLVKNDLIIVENFTNNHSDYLKKDIINSIKKYDDITSVNTKLKKEELFEVLKHCITTLLNYSKKDISKIIKIQTFFLKTKTDKLNKLRGEGFFNREKTNNDTDFFTYETSDEIEDKYYFSYTDSQNIIWFFDIRSFCRLIELNQPNPYTMVIIPRNVIQNALKLLSILNLGVDDDVINQKQLQISIKQLIKQKCIDLFCEIESTTMYCHPEWFLTLHIGSLKKLYRNLEDLWNYRLQITNEIKSRICPPNGLAFNISVNEINNYRNRYELQNLILNEVIKFQNSEIIEARKMGYTYFMIGMVRVSKDCYETHPFLAV